LHNECIEEEKTDEEALSKLMSEVPSQNMINVGACFRYAKKSMTKMMKNGIFEHSENIKFKNLCLEYPLEEQGPFDMIVCKLVDLFNQLYEEKADSIFEKLNNYCEEHKIVFIDPPQKVKSLLFRETIDDK
jgi:hypothetical protein